MQDAPEKPERPLPDDFRRWVEADLLSREQAERIAHFEAERAEGERSGRASRAVALLGALTLVSGFGSLIAYNWDKFADGVKLGGLGVLLACSLAAVLLVKRSPVSETALRTSETEGESTSLDVALLIASGLTLAGLTLVSQIYHQDGELWQLLFAWSFAVAPLMSFSRTRFAHVFWYLGLAFSLLSSFEDVADSLRHVSSDSDHAAWMSIVLYGTLGIVLAERFAASRFAGRAWVGRGFVRLLLILLGTMGGLSWFHGEEGKFWFWGLGLLSFLAIFFAAPESLRQIGFGSQRQVTALFGVGILLAVLPLGFAVESGFAAFLAFVLFWGFAWYLAEQAGGAKNARLSVFLIGGRVVIASFELFESLLVTGGALIGFGVLALVWSRQSMRRIAEKGARRG